MSCGAIVLSREVATVLLALPDAKTVLDESPPGGH
jgi:hypothetical protein